MDLRMRQSVAISGRTDTKNMRAGGGGRGVFAIDGLLSAPKLNGVRTLLLALRQMSKARTWYGPPSKRHWRLRRRLTRRRNSCGRHQFSVDD